MDLDLPLQWKPEIPERFDKTDRHINCPELRIVHLQSLNDTRVRAMVLLGIVTEAPESDHPDAIRKGDLVLAMPREFGYRGMFVKRASQVHPKPPRA